MPKLIETDFPFFNEINLCRILFNLKNFMYLQNIFILDAFFDSIISCSMLFYMMNKKIHFWCVSYLFTFRIADKMMTVP